jgi:hypothetical protein
MGGTVGWAVAHRADPSDVVDPGRTRRPPVPRASREEPLPAGCEVDPANPGTLVFDLPGDVLEFGSLKQGVTVEKDVTVRNTGSGPLCVARIETGCGCVKAKMMGDLPLRIEPTRTATLRVTVDTANREGEQTKEVKLHTNDPARRLAVLVVKLDVRLGVMAATNFLNFGRHVRNHPATQTLRLKSPKDDAAWTVVGLESPVAFTFEAKEVEPNDPVFRVVDVVITHPGAASHGPRNDPLKVKLSHPDRSEIDLRTAIQVVNTVNAAPPAVVFGLVREDTLTAPFPLKLLAGEAGHPFKVTGVRVDGKGFLAGEARAVSPGEWIVELRADTKGLPAGRATGEAVVSLDDPETKEIRVPLRVEVLPPPAVPSK